MENKLYAISPEDTKMLIHQKDDLIILDVRTENEFLYEGRLEGAILMDYLKPRIFKRELKNLDLDKTYLVYCATGKVSKEACELIMESGVKKIYEMQGGLKAWQKNEDLVCSVSKLDEEEVIEARKKIITRINRIEGQMRGIKKMLLKGEYCGDILNQSLAVKSALNSVNTEIMEMFSNVCIKSEKEREDFYKYLKKLMS